MKWKVKGHEYDDVYHVIESKKRFFLFGAGDYGRQFINIFRDEIVIAGWIDNDRSKHGKDIHGYACTGLSEIRLSTEEAIIITMSQIARVEPVRQLEENGFQYNRDYFLIEEFLSIYFVYRYDKVYFSSVSFLPSTVCNLNCRYCLNFNPFAKKFYQRKWEELVHDVDLFFACVDRIMLFHVSGGEPMLYPYTADIIEYIDQTYGDRIDTLRTVTNGTVLPKQEMLEKLSRCNVEITVDDYRDAVPEKKAIFDQLIALLKQYKIRHYVNKVDEWIDLAPERTDYSAWTEEQLIRHRDSCTQSWQELRDGKLFSCNYAAYAEVAGLTGGGTGGEEAYDMTGFSAEKRKELVEFRLGFTDKGYTSFCKRCRGFTTYNHEAVRAAEQATKNG